MSTAGAGVAGGEVCGRGVQVSQAAEPADRTERAARPAVSCSLQATPDLGLRPQAPRLQVQVLSVN